MRAVRARPVDADGRNTLGISAIVHDVDRQMDGFIEHDLRSRRIPPRSRPRHFHREMVTITAEGQPKAQSSDNDGCAGENAGDGLTRRHFLALPAAESLRSVPHFDHFPRIPSKYIEFGVAGAETRHSKPGGMAAPSVHERPITARSSSARRRPARTRDHRPSPGQRRRRRC